MADLPWLQLDEDVAGKASPHWVMRPNLRGVAKKTKNQNKKKCSQQKQKKHQHKFQSNKA